jgi:hypothetical protein
MSTAKQLSQLEQIKNRIQKIQLENEIKSNKDNQLAGYFQKYSIAQEASLIELLVWLKKTIRIFLMKTIF